MCGNKYFVRDITDHANPVKWQYKYSESLGNMAIMVHNENKESIEVIATTCKFV